jgi:F-box/leucine-rich repeat protein 7
MGFKWLITQSFCCALSDTSVEVIALSLPHLRSLNLAFCGSAVSDNSIRTISLHLGELREISVRGCVRVTKGGVESLCLLSRGTHPGVVGGSSSLSGHSICEDLEKVDLSQCRNFGGGSRRWWASVSRNGKIKFAL